MCDTMVATGAAVAGGTATLFAKNSDRQPNEAQVLEMHARATHRAGASVRLTYIEIAQVRETHAVLLSRPFWIWGAEIGANEHGVVIGNEAVFARRPSDRDPGLIGMDLLRLGLERGATAREALEVMIALLERHGQGGNCGHASEQFYDNSFIVADAHQAFVLESFGRHWAVEDVVGIRTISNALSIGTGWSRTSAGLETLARDSGWNGGGGRLDFAAAFADAEREAPGQGRRRCARSAGILAGIGSGLQPQDLMATLRDHGGHDPGSWRPDVGTDRSICMHAHPAVGRLGQTTGAMVCALHPGRAVHWVTGTAAPCSALFRPVTFESGLPDTRDLATDRCDPQTLWWSHEALHREILRDYPARIAAIAAERDALQAAMLAEIDAACDAADRAGALRTAVARCWTQADAAESRWQKTVAAMPIAAPADPAYLAAWAALDARAGRAANEDFGRDHERQDRQRRTHAQPA